MTTPKRTRGRPRKADVDRADVRLTIRLRAEDVERLDWLCAVTGGSATQVVRDALAVQRKLVSIRTGQQHQADMSHA